MSIINNVILPQQTLLAQATAGYLWAMGKGYETETVCKQTQDKQLQTQPPNKPYSTHVLSVIGIKEISRLLASSHQVLD